MDNSLNKLIILVEIKLDEEIAEIAIPFLFSDKESFKTSLNEVIQLRESKLIELNELWERCYSLICVDHTDELYEMEGIISNYKDYWQDYTFSANNYSVKLSLLTDNSFKVIALEEWFDSHKFNNDTKI